MYNQVLTTALALAAVVLIQLGATYYWRHRANRKYYAEVAVLQQAACDARGGLQATGSKVASEAAELGMGHAGAKVEEPKVEAPFSAFPKFLVW